MLFIPQEIKEKLAQLEEDNKNLQAENNRLAREVSAASKGKSASTAVWIIVSLLAIAIVYIIYQQFVVIPKIEANAKPPVEDLNAVMVRDGKIEKWNRVDDGTLVYRIQLGAYADFDINKYKQNLEGLYQDSIDGFHKVSLGAFSRLSDAQEFQQRMVNMGMDNVYIVAYESNNPIGLIEAEQKESTQTE